jgi:hyaluronate lyase
MPLDDMDALRLRWRDMLTGGAALDTNLSPVKKRLQSIGTTAKHWQSSIDNSATRQTLWQDLGSTNVSADISTTYSRLLSMALAWATQGQQDSVLLADTISGMEWMDANRYNAGSNEYDNWFDWEIGAPTSVVDIAVLLNDQLAADQLSRYMAAVERFDSDPTVLQVDNPKPSASTGANRADKCNVAPLRGVLVKASTKIALAVGALGPVFEDVTSGDGFYNDGSFIQHKGHPYTGSYGLELLNDIANLLYLLAGSQWDVPPATRARLPHLVNDSFAPLIYEGAMMDMVRGRAVSRASSSDHAAGHTAIAALLRIAQFASPDLALPLQRAIKRWLVDDAVPDRTPSLPLDLIGEAVRLLNDSSISPADLPSASRVYASMDRALHLRPAWAAGVAMHSTRILNFESIDQENLHGWHTGDGMTFLYDADLLQFSDSFWPTVDPQRLPGTTVIAGSKPGQSKFGGSDVVGGASLDGYSAVMMQIDPDGHELQAKKSWFFLDDELVALGADIQSSSPASSVETIVENRRLTSSTTFATDPNGAWAHLQSSVPGASIGYVFPDGPPLLPPSEDRTGAWHDINGGGSKTPLTAQYQTLWFDHGLVPAGAMYPTSCCRVKARTKPPPMRSRPVSKLSRTTPLLKR